MHFMYMYISLFPDQLHVGSMLAFICMNVAIYAVLTQCDDPVHLDNGKVTIMATYTCDSGFELIGDATTTCTLVDMNSTELQPALPSCRRECSE